jgi:hypothetical protein
LFRFGLIFLLARVILVPQARTAKGKTMKYNDNMIRADITSKDASGNPVTRGGSFDSLATMMEQIELFVGVANLISIVIKK